MPNRHRILDFIKSLKAMYSATYFLLNIVLFLLYYYVINAILAMQQQGIAISTVPQYAIFLLAISGSMLFTVAIYGFFRTKSINAKYSGTAGGSITMVLGGVISGCGCHAAILYSILAFAIGGSSAYAANLYISHYAAFVFGILIAFNIALFIYYTNKTYAANCALHNKRNKR